MGLNIKSLRAYIFIMKTGTLGAAAKEMHISESALSRQLAVLEADLGLKLFSREKRRLQPTREGHAFFDVARRILDSIEYLPDIVEEIKRDARMTISLMAMPRAAAAFVAPAVAKFTSLHPEAQVSVDVQSGRRLARWVASRQYDIGLGTLPIFHDQIESRMICQAPAVAVFSENDPMGLAKSVQLSELVEREIILLPKETLLGRQVRSMLDREGLEVKSSITTSTTALACDLVSQGTGATIADALTPFSIRRKVNAVLIEPGFKMNYGVFFPRGVKRNKLVNTFSEIIEATAQEVLADCRQQMAK